MVASAKLMERCSDGVEDRSGADRHSPRGHGERARGQWR